MIIKSLIDTDFYKLSMQQAVLHNYPATIVKYSFKWRNIEQMSLRIPMEDFVGRVKKELDNLCQLRFNKDELEYLSKVSFFKPDYIEYLRLFQLNRSYIHVSIDEADELQLHIEGPWVNTILFEVPVLAIISQLYTENCKNFKQDWQLIARKRLENKFTNLVKDLGKEKNFRFADFGTRRRASIAFQDEMVNFIVSNYRNYFNGTSNVMLAMKYGVKAIGTMAHEWLQAHQQLGVRLIDSQKAALQTWADEYRGQLGIALSDVEGYKSFLCDFDRYFALLFDGCRHDSGDPIIWADTLINHYEKLKIDPKTKNAVFSDGLTFEMAIDIYRRFGNKINTSFGIGTYLTNDCGFTAPQIVIKMVECNGCPVAKISDSTGKGMCQDPEFLKYFIEVIYNKVKKGEKSV